MSLRDWVKQSGAFKIGELTTNDSVLRHLTTGTKYLECTSSGVIAIPCDKAYGTWEYSVNSQSFFFGFVKTDKIDGYTSGWALSIYSDETIRLLRGGSSGQGFSTAINYIQEDTWYDYRITRTKDNTITCYIRGGNFGDNWTKITVATGSNPVTNDSYPTSYYLVLQVTKNSKVTNIKFYDGVRQ